jgi:hypothetical protein
MARTPLCDPEPDGPRSGAPGPGSPAPDLALGDSIMADGAGHGWRPSCVPDDAPDWCCVPPPEEPDYDPGAVLDEIIARTGAGEIEIPPDAGPEGVPRFRGPVVVLGAPADLTAADLAGAAFRQGGPAATLPPGPALGALTGDAAADPRYLTDDELLGAAAETLRQQARAAWERYRLAAEFGRRPRHRPRRRPRPRPRPPTLATAPPGRPGDLTALPDNLGPALTPIAADPGDHGLRENSCRPSRKLAHLIRARTATCPPPAARPTPSTATSTTPSPGPRAPPAKTTSHPPAPATTTPSTPPAGNSSRSRRASCAGPPPADGPTPKNPPNTTYKRVFSRCASS